MRQAGRALVGWSRHRPCSRLILLVEECKRLQVQLEGSSDPGLERLKCS